MQSRQRGTTFAHAQRLLGASRYLLRLARLEVLARESSTTPMPLGDLTLFHHRLRAQERWTFAVPPRRSAVPDEPSWSPRKSAKSCWRGTRENRNPLSPRFDIFFYIFSVSLGARGLTTYVGSRTAGMSPAMEGQSLVGYLRVITPHTNRLERAQRVAIDPEAWRSQAVRSSGHRQRAGFAGACYGDLAVSLAKPSLNAVRVSCLRSS